MLIPFVGVFISMAILVAWFPIPDPADPEQPFMRRLAGTVKLGLKSWAIYDLVHAVAFRYEYPVEEAYSHTSKHAVVNFIDGHGHGTWAYGDGEDLLILPRVWDPIPLSPTSSVPDPVLFWLSDGLATFAPAEDAEIPSPRSRLGQVFNVFLAIPPAPKKSKSKSKSSAWLKAKGAKGEMKYFLH